MTEKVLMEITGCDKTTGGTTWENIIVNTIQDAINVRTRCKFNKFFDSAANRVRLKCAIDGKDQSIYPMLGYPINSRRKDVNNLYDFSKKAIKRSRTKKAAVVESPIMKPKRPKRGSDVGYSLNQIENIFKKLCIDNGLVSADQVNALVTDQVSKSFIKASIISQQN